MKHLFRIFFIGLLALSGLWEEELSRIPALVRHYQVHLESNPEMDFLQFWEFHYGRKKHLERGDRRHSNLPFRHGLQHQLTIVFVLPVEMEREHIDVAPAKRMVIQTFQYCFAVLENEHCPLLQPPRLS